MTIVQRIAVVSLLLLAAPAAAQDAADYPNKPVRIIVNVAPGGGVDTATRIVAKKMSERLGQSFVIENRSGAGGNIGAEAVFHSPPDGYTLMASSGSPLAINGYLYKKLNYEPEGFEPIAVLSQIPNVLVVRPDFPASDLKVFLDYVKANPGKLNFASQGAGTAAHLTGELFMSLTGTKLTHVPYKGTSPALNDLVAGHVDLTFIQLSASYELHKVGKVKILAVATEKRVDILPDVPTLAEYGMPELLSRTWNALSAPPGTPAAIVAKLNATVTEALAESEVKGRFRELHMTAEGGSLAATRAYVEEDRARWGKVVKAAGLQPQ